MPVTGQGSFAQFAQTINQQQASAAQFAVALAKLKQAEQQFDQRHQFLQKQFDFKQKAWESEKQLFQKRLEHLDFENKTMSAALEKQEQLPEAFKKIGTAVGGVAKAFMEGDKDELLAAQDVMAKTMQDSVVSGTADITLPMMRNFMAAYGVSPEAMGAALGRRGVEDTKQLPGSEMLKFTRALETDMVQTMAGYTEEELGERYQERLRANNEQMRSITASINASLGNMRVISDLSLTNPDLTRQLMAASQSRDPNKIARMMGPLGQAAASTSDPKEHEQIKAWIDGLRQIGQRNVAINNWYSVQRQKVAAAKTFARNFLPQLLPEKDRPMTEEESGAKTTAAQKVAAAQASVLSAIYDDLSTTKEYRLYMSSGDQDTVNTNLALLKDTVSDRLRVMEGLSDEQKDYLLTLFVSGLDTAKKEEGFVLAAPSPTEDRGGLPAPPNPDRITFGTGE